MDFKVSLVAVKLYKWGWRASDMYEYMRDYGLDYEEAKRLRKELAELERSGANAWL